MNDCSPENASAVPAIAPGLPELDSKQTASVEAAAKDASAKLQEYVNCYNRIDESAHRTITRYTSWVADMEAGPTGQEMNIYGLYSLDAQDIENCKTALSAAAKQAPVMVELDAAAVAYGDALVALGQAVDAAYQYYDREDYKDDGFAKGMQLHAPLAESFKRFGAASTLFSAALNQENDKRLEEDLARMEKSDGRKMPYLHAAMMLRAKLLLRIIEGEDFSATAAQEKLAAYEAIADEAEIFRMQNPQAGLSGWSSVSKAMEDFRKAAKERVRRIRDNIPYDEGEKLMLRPGSAWMVEGSQEKAINAYNDLVDASNNLR